MKEENGVYSISKTISACVVDAMDHALKNAMVDYAKKRSKELGKEIEIIFIDKHIADEIIDLGIKEYMKLKGMTK